MDLDFTTLGAAALADRVRSKDLSAREVVEATLRAIEADDHNAFVVVDGDRALAQARAIDDRLAAGEKVGPLAGVPLGVKDLEDAAGMPTSHGSMVVGSDGPVAVDSAQVARLRAAGCVVVGKTNTPEMGFQPQTTNAKFGTTTNPWDPDRTPGGSSGGSAAALAAGLVPLATGSDGGGSIRIPSAMCGLSGLKPSLGRVPHGDETPPDWVNLSTRGPMARSVKDIALALDVVVAPDPTDLRSLPRAEPTFAGAVVEPHVPHRVAWSPTLGYAPVDSEVRAICERAVRKLEELGSEVVEVETVFETDPIIAWMTMTSVYNLRAVEHLKADEWDQLDPGMLPQLEYAKTITGVQVVRADDECYRMNRRLVELFRDVRLLITPTTSAVAPICGESGLIDGKPEVNWVRFTYAFNMTRSPAGTVCAGLTSSGLPVGLQLVGPQHGDLVVLRAMAALEDGLGQPTAPRP